MDEQVKIQNRTLALSNLEKIYFPEDGYAKADVIDYYRKISVWILPFLINRPESLHRYPNGINGQDFYQKNVDHQPPRWVKTVSISSDEGRKKINYLVCQDMPTLIYMANLGYIEINPWSSRIGHVDNPDYIIIDLDPEDILFMAVIKTARAVKKILDQVGAPSFVKTSGATGLHVLIPTGARYTYDQVRRFAQIVARRTAAALPKITSVEHLPKRRQKKVYVDFLQNGRGQTIAAPYSIRPRAGAPVSTPLKWSEVNTRLDPAKFNLKSMASRLKKIGNAWPDFWKKSVNLSSALKSLDSKS